MKISQFKHNNNPELKLLSDFFDQWDLFKTENTITFDYLNSVKEYLNICNREINIDDLDNIKFDGTNAWQVESFASLMAALQISKTSFDELLKSLESNKIN